MEATKKKLEADIESAKKARDEANALYAKENRGRKAIHNKLLELQGNIRVLARVRPMLEVSRGGRRSWYRRAWVLGVGLILSLALCVCLTVIVGGDAGAGVSVDDNGVGTCCCRLCVRCLCKLVLPLSAWHNRREVVFEHR